MRTSDHVAFKPTQAKNPTMNNVLIGRSGRAETSRQVYSIDAVNEFDPLFEDIYDYCDLMGLDVDTLIHEIGAGQMEINFLHGEPLGLADKVFFFKRTLREAAMRHDMFATFMAKPIAGEPGSAMHVHQSVLDKATGRNIFSNEDGSPSREFYWYIGGLQKYIPAAMALFAPYVNSYRRLARFTAAPINDRFDQRAALTGEVVTVTVSNAGAMARAFGGMNAVFERFDFPEDELELMSRGFVEVLQQGYGLEASRSGICRAVLRLEQLQPGRYERDPLERAVQIARHQFGPSGGEATPCLRLPPRTWCAMLIARSPPSCCNWPSATYSSPRCPAVRATAG